MPGPKISWDTLYLGKECAQVLHIADTTTIYLLGTNHVSAYSARIVRKLIARVEPDIVAIELCWRRLEEANRFGGDPNFGNRYRDLEHIPKYWRKRAAAELMRLRLVTTAMDYCRSNARLHQTSKAPANQRLSPGTGVNPEAPWLTKLPQTHHTLKWRGYRVRPARVEDVYIAADIFAPFQRRTWFLESNRSNVLHCPEVRYKIVMVDLPIERTYIRLMAALADKEKEVIRQYEGNFVQAFLENRTGIMGRIWQANPRIVEVMVEERNRYLAYGLLRAASAAGVHDGRKVRVVGLVGRRHVDGIMEIWKSNCLQNWLANKVLE